MWYLRCMMLGLLTLAVIVVEVKSEEKPAQKLTPEMIKNRFYRSWKDVEVIDEGVSFKDPARLSACTYTKSTLSCWGRTGELSVGYLPPPILDLTTNPMRITFLGEDQKDEQGRITRSVRPGIFRLDGDNRLIIASKAWTTEKKWPDGKDYPERPKDFTSTKENGVYLSISVPTTHMEQDQ